MNQKLLEAVKKQINAEFYSAYLYLSMSSWCEHEGFKGMAHWMRIQAQEEQTHAITLHNQLIERGERSTFEVIEKPSQIWESPLKMFEQVLDHEKNVTSMINNLATISLEEKDHAFYGFIQMFVKEQVEEEANASDICTRLKRAENNAMLLEMLDKELGTRIFTPSFSKEAL